MQSLPYVAVLSLSHVLLQLHCITAVTASRGTACHSSTVSTLQSLPHVAVHLLSHVLLQLHCITAVTASRGSNLTLSRATVATLQSLTLSHSTVSTLHSLPHVAVILLSHVPLKLRCITAVTASHSSALTLARATAAALHHCAITASRGTALTLSRSTVATHCTTRTCTLFFSLYIYKMQTVFLVASWPLFSRKKNLKKKKSFRICFFSRF